MGKRLKIVTNKYIPFKGFNAMIVLCWMVVRRDCVHEITDKVVNHENIHYAQERELLYVGFYLLYGIFFLLYLIGTFNWHRAYRANPLEKEAYDNDNNMSYLDNRKHFAWVKCFAHE